MDLAGNVTAAIGDGPRSRVPSLAETQKIRPLTALQPLDGTSVDRSAGVVFELRDTEPTQSTYSIGAFPRATESGAFAPIAAVERASFAEARERANTVQELVAEFVNGAATLAANDD